MKRDLQGQYLTELGRATSSALQIHRALMEHPIATSNWLVEKTGMTPATVKGSGTPEAAWNRAGGATAQKCNRLFSYSGYREIMDRGTELPAP